MENMRSIWMVAAKKGGMPTAICSNEWDAAHLLKSFGKHGEDWEVVERQIPYSQWTAFKDAKEPTNA